jgi:ABC-type uncharacterized transport system YnjBCD ATPase subunit
MDAHTIRGQARQREAARAVWSAAVRLVAAMDDGELLTLGAQQTVEALRRALVAFDAAREADEGRASLEAACPHGAASATSCARCRLSAGL